MSGDADLADAGEQHEKDRRDRREFDGGDAVAAALPRVGLDTVRSRYHGTPFALLLWLARPDPHAGYRPRGGHAHNGIERTMNSLTWIDGIHECSGRLHHPVLQHIRVDLGFPQIRPFIG